MTDITPLNEHDLQDAAVEKPTYAMNPEALAKYAAESSLPKGWMPKMLPGRTNALTLLYPLPEREEPYSNELTPQAQREVEGLLKFFYDLVPTKPENLAIYTYPGLVEGEPIRWVRFETEHNSTTFCVLELDFPRWISAVLDDETIEWCLRDNENEALKKRGMYLNVSRAPIELPLHFFWVRFDRHPIDDLYDGDFIALETLSAKLQEKITNKLALATMKANVLVNAEGKKDHDLYLVFKATDNFSALNVTLDKVYPKLPESGEISLGDNPTTLFEWNGKEKKVLVAVRQINNYCKQINKAIQETRALLNQHPIIQQQFDEKLKVMLFAATHFTKMIYGFSAEYGEALVYEVVNDVLERLTRFDLKHRSDGVAKGLNWSIGLDLNSWVVWEYTDGKHPVRVTDPEVDFVNTLFNRYTESFIQALYAVLLNTRNPLIKPYDYREVADLSDGIAIGTVRLAK